MISQQSIPEYIRDKNAQIGMYEAKNRLHCLSKQDIDSMWEKCLRKPDKTAKYKTFKFVCAHNKLKIVQNNAHFRSHRIYILNYLYWTF